ncbi:MAG: hypothetical protein O7H41_01620 [Planctomycetota bacterium]|nr:hypothetical protein [Planctomycetota bacterium]
MSAMCAWLPALAGAGFLLVSCSGGGGGAPAEARGVDFSENLQPLGEASPLVAESDVTPDRSTPEMLLRSIIDGVGREDLSFLCRTVDKFASTPRLTKVDQAWAWRTFLMRAPRASWTNLGQLLDDGGVQISDDDGQLALASFEAGPSVGMAEIRILKISGEWYLEVPE